MEAEAIDGAAEEISAIQSSRPQGVMKRARWGATHRIHEHFVDGFPELEERFVREREAAERRFEYNLGSRNFATKREGEEGIDTLKVLFRKLDRAIGLRDATMVQTIREEFLAELRHWNWRKGARVEFKRRKLVHDNARLSIDDNNAAMALAETLRKSNADDLRGPEFPPPPSGGRGNTTKNDTNNNGEKKNKKKHHLRAGAGSSRGGLLPENDRDRGAASGANLENDDDEQDDDDFLDNDDDYLDDDDDDDEGFLDVDKIDQKKKNHGGTSGLLKPMTRFPGASSSAPLLVGAPQEDDDNKKGAPPQKTPADPEEKRKANDARRHLLAESVAVALVTLKWRCLNPDANEERKEKTEPDDTTRESTRESPRDSASSSETNDGRTDGPARE